MLAERMLFTPGMPLNCLSERGRARDCWRSEECYVITQDSELGTDNMDVNALMPVRHMAGAP